MVSMDVPPLMVTVWLAAPENWAVSPADGKPKSQLPAVDQLVLPPPAVQVNVPASADNPSTQIAAIPAKAKVAQ
jgi:hypothetical protein